MGSISLSPDTKYCSHSLNTGSVGTGKSTLLKKQAEVDWSRGRKVIDLLDESRLENAFYSLPNRDLFLYKGYVEKLAAWGYISEDDVLAIKAGLLKCTDVVPFEPRGFPTEVFVLAVPGTPKKLPEIFRLYRIPFGDLEIPEWRILLGGTSKEQATIIEEALKRSKSYVDFIGLFSNRSFLLSCLSECDLKELKDLVRRIDRVFSLNIICEDDDGLALDLVSVMKDVGTISSFSYFNLEDENLIYLIVSFLLRKIFKLRKDRLKTMWQFPECSIILREVQNIAPARGQSGLFSYEGQRSSTYTLHRIMKEPRDIKIRLRADSQSPDSIAKHIRKGFGSANIFQLDLIQLNSLTEILYLDQKTFIGLQNAEVGVHAKKIKPQVRFSGDRTGVHFSCIAPPPRSWPKKPEDLFFRVWRDVGGGWKEVSIQGNKSFVSKDLFQFNSQRDEDNPSRKVERIRMMKGNILLGAMRKSGKKVFKPLVVSKLPTVSQLLKLSPGDWSLKEITSVLAWSYSKKLLKYDPKSKSYSLPSKKVRSI